MRVNELIEELKSWKNEDAEVTIEGRDIKKVTTLGGNKLALLFLEEGIVEEYENRIEELEETISEMEDRESDNEDHICELEKILTQIKNWIKDYSSKTEIEGIQDILKEISQITYWVY